MLGKIALAGSLLLIGIVQSAATQLPVRGTTVGHQSTVPIKVSMDVRESDGGRAIHGTTNLPDGTKMQATMRLSCRDCPLAGEWDLTVLHGGFALSFPPQLDAGTYDLEITTPIAELEPKSVRTIIGQRGENLHGDSLAREIVPGAGPTLDFKQSIDVGLGPAGGVGEPDTETMQKSKARGDYAQGINEFEKERYRNARDEILRQISQIHFSVACGVFPDGAWVDALTGTKERTLSDQFPTAIDFQFHELLIRAVRGGKLRASKPGACSYWREHPEVAGEMEREAQSAMSLPP